MADNATLPVTGTIQVACDEIGGVKFQRVKVTWGVDGTANDVSASNPLPISVATIPSHGVTNAGEFVVQVDDLVPGVGPTNLGKAEDSQHSSGDTGLAVWAVRNDSGAVLAGTTGDYIPFTTDSTGALRVTTGSGGTSMTDDAAVTIGTTLLTPVGGVYKSAMDSVDDGDGGIFAMTIKRALYVSHLTPLGDSMVDDTLDALKVTIAGGSIAGIVDDAAFAVGTSEVLPIGFLADESATDSVNEGDIGAPRITLDRKVITTLYSHAAAGGHTPFKNLDVDETEDEIKGSGGKLFWLHAINLTASVLYLKIYNNTAAGVTVGTTVPDLTFPVPTLATTNGVGFCIHFGDAGLQLSTGITIAATTGFADNNSSAPATNALIVNGGYL
jgi:hypothetical protein